MEELPKTVCVILVKDTLWALGEFAKFWRKKLGFHAVAVAGSCGKTTTKEMIYALLSKFYKTEKTKENFNNLIGVPLSILSFKEGVEIGVLELGTNTPGEIERLAEIVYPQTSVITCIKEEHLEGLKDLKGVLEEEISLFKKTDPKGTLVYNFDDTLLREAVKEFPQKKLSVGFEKGADVKLSYEEKEEKFVLKIEFQEKKEEIDFNLLSRHDALNLGFAIAVCLCVGLKLEEILNALKEKKDKLFTRAKVYNLSQFTIIDDSYNANPWSMENSIKWAKALASRNKKKFIGIIGDMKELGDMSDKLHQKIAELLKEVVDKAVFIGSFADIYANEFKLSKKPYKCFSSTEEFLENFDSLVKENFFEKDSLILIKGSRALFLEKITQKFLEKESKDVL